MRVVLDVNVLVSLAIGGRALAPLDAAWLSERFTLVTSSPLLGELADVLSRPSLQRYLTAEGAALVLQRVEVLGELGDPEEPYPEFTDPDDAYLLAMLRDLDADVLVTGDKALLELGDFLGKPIFTPAELVARLQG